MTMNNKQSWQQWQWTIDNNDNKQSTALIGNNNN
jgi:hypothetical protein